ncbi:hypothetical protein B0T13DRAFT_50104 [Neurospora crassa]|nr:hypothetical protein B0T13DRAFT_50104 [Neurospora crassa]
MESQNRLHSQEKDYNDIIARLKSANTFLHDLVKDSRVLAPGRKRQSHNKIIRLLRNLAQSLFDALRNAATSCYCPQPHKACLELVARDLAFIRKLDTEDQLAKKVPFYVVLTSMVSDKTLTECDEPKKPPQFNVRWISFRVQCGDFDTPLSPQPTLTHATNSTASLACSESTLWTSPRDESEKGSIKILSSPPSNARRKLSSLFKGHGKTVTFDSISATQKLVQVSTPTASLRVSSPQPHRVSISDSPLSNLCQLTVNKGKKPASTKDQCHGWIMDSTKGRRFGLYPPRWNDDISVQPMHVQPRSDTSEVRTSFTLRQILDHNNLRDSTSGPGLIPNLDFSTKLRIAQAISVGILQLHGTPWMSNTVLTLNDIVLLVGPDSTTCELRPFISKPVSDTMEGTPGNMQLTHCSNICVPVNCSGSRPFHPTVFSLGLLLLQLVLGRIDDTLDLTTTTITPNKTLQLCNNNSIGAMNSIPLLDVSRAHKLAELYEKEMQNDVLEKAGDQCRDVINWCLQTWKVTRGLDDGTFCDEFNVEVVEKLEREIRCCS